MGEIIEGKFGKKKSESVIKLTAENVPGIAKRLVDMKIFVQSLLNTDPHAQRRVEEQRHIVTKYTDEELIGWVANSQEAQWRQKPYFFSAVCDELKKRLDVLMDAIRK